MTRSRTTGFTRGSNDTQPSTVVADVFDPTPSILVAINAQSWLPRSPLPLAGLDRFPTGIGRGPTYDWPNPTLRRIPNVSLLTHAQGLVLNTLAGLDRFPTGIGRGPVYDYPNPRGPTPGISLRTHLDPLKLTLAGLDRFPTGIGRGPTYDYPNPSPAKMFNVWGVAAIATQTNYEDRLLNLLGVSQDTFFGLAGNPTFDWPVPRGATHAIVLRTHIDPYKISLDSADRFFGLAGHPNFDWPVPRGATHGILLRTHLDPLKLTLRSKDVFFGLAGNPTFDWPVPKAPRPLPYLQPPPNELPTLFTVLAAPFHLLDWPNPAAARDRGIAARAWNEGWQNPIVNVLPMPLSQYDWPAPRAAAYPQDLRVFYPTPFAWQRDFGTITDTDALQKPVNVVMAGDVPIKDRWREFDIRPLNIKTTRIASATPGQRLNGPVPSFKTRTDTRGYD